jgi:hypothetical protein
MPLVEQILSLNISPNEVPQPASALPIFANPLIVDVQTSKMKDLTQINRWQPSLF